MTRMGNKSEHGVRENREEIYGFFALLRVLRACPASGVVLLFLPFPIRPIRVIRGFSFVFPLCLCAFACPAPCGVPTLPVRTP
jgi:hypothetical protein